MIFFFSVKTLFFSRSAEFRNHYVLSGATQRRALRIRRQSEEIKILSISFSRVEFEPTTCRVYNLCCDWPLFYYYIFK